MRSSVLLAILALIGFSTVARAADTVTFHKQPAAAGDSSRQTMRCDLALTMSIRQAGQIVQEQKQGLLRQQDRQLTILEVAGDAALKADVKYNDSKIALRSSEAPAEPELQPVTGKTYRVTRQGDELTITYPDGTVPPPEELAIVQENMSTFGLPNPIAQFFDGRELKVGETLNLPAHLARELLGFAETNNSVSDFRLKLAQIKPAKANQAKCAVFQILLRAKDPEQSGVSMDLTGQLTMEIETCRSLAVSLRGPVVASEMHGPEAAQYEVYTEGDIQVAVQARYLRR